MYNAILSYKGFQIIVENYIYKLQINPTKHYLTMDDVKHAIDKIDNNNFDGILKRIEKRDCTSRHESSLKCQKKPPRKQM